MNQCPICGYPDLHEPAYDAHGCASFEICRSCGTEFGYDDARKSFELLRRRWVSEGMPWYSPAAPAAPNWDPERQLRSLVDGFTSVLPEALFGRALNDGDGDLAWNRADAIDVLTLINGAGFRVLGMQVWASTLDQQIIPASFLYDWRINKAPADKDIFDAAIEYVREFQWRQQDIEFSEAQPYFNLKVDIAPNKR